MRASCAGVPRIGQGEGLQRLHGVLAALEVKHCAFDPVDVGEREENDERVEDGARGEEHARVERVPAHDGGR